MPEATNCQYVTVASGEVRHENDDEFYFDWVTGLCQVPADHKVVTRAEGAADTFTEYLCCQHRTQVMDELAHGGHLGIELVADAILGPVVQATVQRMDMGWLCKIAVVSRNGLPHNLAPVQLDVVTREEAEAFAAAQVTRLQAIASGNDWDGTL